MGNGGRAIGQRWNGELPFAKVELLEWIRLLGPLVKVTTQEESLCTGRPLETVHRIVRQNVNTVLTVRVNKSVQT